MELPDFMCFLHENKQIDLYNLLGSDEIGCINRLKVQKYVYLAQTCLNNHFGYEFSVYNNGPYSPELANYYYEVLDINRLTMNIANRNRNYYDNSFTIRFLELFKDKEPEWLIIASTLIDNTNYFDEEEILHKVYVMKSDYDRLYRSCVE
jgi:uncharacterized protein YwgA